MQRFNIVTDALEADEEPRPGYAQRSSSVGVRLGSSLIGGSVYELGEGERVCPYHYHYAQEEWLYVVAGRPTLRSPDGERELRPGDVVCFPTGPEGAHAVRGPARILILSTRRWPEIPVYPDSDKLGARPVPYPGQPQDRGNFRRADELDYWDGEE